MVDNSEQTLQTLLSTGDLEGFCLAIKPIVWWVVQTKRFDTLSNEDAVADAYLKILKALPSYDVSKGGLKGFVFTLASQAVWDHNRSQARQLPVGTCQIDPSLPHPPDKVRSEGMDDLLHLLRSEGIKQHLLPNQHKQVARIADTLEESGALTITELGERLGLPHISLMRIFKRLRQITQ